MESTTLAEDARGVGTNEVHHERTSPEQNATDEISALALSYAQKVQPSKKEDCHEARSIRCARYRCEPRTRQGARCSARGGGMGPALRPGPRPKQPPPARPPGET